MAIVRLTHLPASNNIIMAKRVAARNHGSTIRRRSLFPDIDHVAQAFTEAFTHGWGTLRTSAMLRRIPRIRAPRFVDDRAAAGLAVVSFRAPHTIDISRRLLRDVAAELRSNRAIVRTAVLADVSDRSNHSRHNLDAIVTQCILDLSASFLIIHELFHILGGHVGAARARRAGQGVGMYALVDASSDIASRGATPETAIRAYYREVEADNSALQWMMLAEPRRSIRTLLAAVSSADATTCTCIALLDDGPGRFTVFRALVTALLLMIRILERRRGAQIRAAAPEHPYPATRLLAGLFTLMEQFVEITKPAIDRRGRKTQRLSDVQAQGMRQFFRTVLSPVLKLPWSSRDRAAAHSGYESFAPLIVLELGNILLGREPATAPARELARIEGLRHEMISDFAPHRCI